MAVIDFGFIGKQDLNKGFGTFSDVVQGVSQTIDKIGHHTWNANVYHVDDFGAAGDGSTDDISAFNLARDQAKTDAGYISLSPGKTYKLSDTWWLGRVNNSDPFVRGIYGNGATILGAVSGQPIIDWTGAHGPDRIVSSLILQGDATNVPSCGMLLARPDTSPSAIPSAGLGLFFKIYTQGSFSTSAIYNYASESNYWLHCYFINNVGDSPFIFTRTNERGITSPNVGLGSNTAGYQMFEGCTFFNNRNPSVANSTCLELSGNSVVYVQKCQFVQNADDHVGVKIIHDLAGGGPIPDHIHIERNLFEGNYGYALYFAHTGATGQFNNITFDKNQLNIPVNADVGSDANTTFVNVNITAETSIDFSASTVSVTEDSVLRMRRTSGGTISVSRTCAGLIVANSGNTVTLSGTVGQVSAWRFSPDTGAMRPPPGRSTLVISSGAITVGGRQVYSIDTEGAASADDLDTINGGYDNQVVSLYILNGTRLTTFKDSTGNLRMAGDFAPTNTLSPIVFRYVLASNLWVEESRSAN